LNRKRKKNKEEEEEEKPLVEKKCIKLRGSHH